MQLMQSSKNKDEAFTLIELMVVIGCLVLLGLMVAPAFASSRNHSARAGCLANLRRLQMAAEMYRTENNDLLMPNAPPGGGNSGWVPSSEGWGNFVANTNVPSYVNSLMGRYLGSNNVGAFRCPGDVVPSSNGLRLRSYAMNGQIAGALTGIALVTIKNVNLGYRVYIKGEDLVCSSPANTFVFADESPVTLNDGYLQVGLSTVAFNDLPAAYLDGGCGFSFADGHGEIHQWETTSLTLPIRFGFTLGGAPLSTSYDNADWLWLKQHASCPQ